MKSRLRRFVPVPCVLMACLIGITSIHSESRNPPPVLFVLDASGSMAEMFGGVPRMVAARVMMGEQLARLDSSIPVGLVAYGNRIPGCASYRLYAPIRNSNRRSLSEQIGQMYPAGATPLAATLQLIGRTILPYHPGTTVVIISDGAESCGGNPVREAQKLIDAGADIRINVIGLDVDTGTAEQLQSVARAGHGNYFDVHNHTDFENAIRHSTDPRYQQPETTTNIIEQNTPTHADSIPYLRILDVRPAPGSNGNRIRLQVAYDFRTATAGDYVVHIQVVNQPESAGRITAPATAAQMPIAVQSDSRYGVDRGESKLEVEIDLTGIGRGPIFVQGELWQTDEVPELRYRSEPVRLTQ